LKIYVDSSLISSPFISFSRWPFSFGCTILNSWVQD
jgi:hypothetical protein